MGFQIGSGQGGPGDTTAAMIAAMNMGSSLISGNSNSLQYQTQSGDYATAAALDKMSAAQALLTGQEQGQKYGRAFQQAFGQTQEQTAGSGTDLTSGSALNRLNDLEEGGAMDQLTMRNDTANQAFGFTQQAAQNTTKAQLAAINAKTASTAGLLTAGLQGLKWAGQNVSSPSGSPQVPTPAQMNSAAWGSGSAD
jgi:hypothetical protein